MLAAMRSANIFMAALFILAVAVQYNDPDPIRWMTMYGLAAVSCLLAVKGKLPWFVPAVIGTVALIWASTLAPGVIRAPSLEGFFGSMQMKTPAVEEAREMFGLLIVALWMAVLAVRSIRAPA
jgi:transmembrane protein TMEM220